jgi:CRISPR system Cascade subunit CasB
MKKNQHIERFINHLQKLVKEEDEDRAALAALRRALSGNPRYVTETFQYIGWYLPETQRQQDPYILVGALFAYHPQSTSEGNMGNHFATLRRSWETAHKRTESLERRFNGLLRAHPDDLTPHLRSAISLLKRDEVPIHWEQLLYDVCYWGHFDRFVQRGWANAFWRRSVQEESDASQENTDFAQED